MVDSTDVKPGSQAGTPHSTRYVWYVIVLLTVVNVVNYVDRMALAILAPEIKADMELSDAQLGLLIGFAFALFYAICGIPIARWADRGTRRNIITIALTVWSLFTALSGAAQNYWHMFIARVGVGAGEAGCFPPASSILCDYVPLRRRSVVFAIHTFGIYAGMMIGMVVSGWLAENVGWRWAFVILGLPGIALAILIRLSLREPKRGFFDEVKADPPTTSFEHTVRTLWNCRTYRLLVIFLVANGFLQYGLNQWWPSFYTRTYQLSLSAIGSYLGIAIGVGSALGLLCGGVLANTAAQRDVGLPLKLGAGVTLFVIPAAMATLFVSSAAASMLMVGVTALFWTMSLGTVLATMYSVTPPQMRATGGAIYIFFMSVFGFGLGPYCVGLLSDFLSQSLGAQALRYAMLAPIAVLPIMVVVLYRAALALPEDLRDVGAKARDNAIATSKLPEVAIGSIATIAVTEDHRKLGRP